MVMEVKVVTVVVKVVSITVKVVSIEVMVVKMTEGSDNDAEGGDNTDLRAELLQLGSQVGIRRMSRKETRQQRLIMKTVKAITSFLMFLITNLYTNTMFQHFILNETLQQIVRGMLETLF